MSLQHEKKTQSSPLTKVFEALGAVTALIAAVTGLLLAFPQVCKSINVEFLNRYVCQRQELKASFNWSQDTSAYPYIISFENYSEGYSSADWFFGDGQVAITSGSQRTVTHEYAESISYTVRLTIHNDYGDSEYYEDDIIVTPRDINLYSDFEQSMENWSMAGDSPLYRDRCGGSNAICGKDGVMGGTYYYIAPYTGDFRDVYDEILTFRLFIRYRDEGAEPSNEVDLKLISSEGILYYDFPDPTQIGVWLPYSVAFQEDAGWRLPNGQATTRVEFENILSTLQELDIRGEYFIGYDESCIDNIQMGSPG